MSAYKDPNQKHEFLYILPNKHGVYEISDQKPKIKEVKDNLDKLQKLHHKLHAILDELNQNRRKDKKNE